MNPSSPHLGLVCITVDDTVRYRALTRKRLLQFGEADQQEMLRELYRDNLARLNGALAFCRAEGIHLYRVTAKLFPFADEPLGQAVLAGFQEGLAQAGRQARDWGIRLAVHPDQFVVLSSDSPQVIANSVKILTLHGRVMDYLCQPRSPWAVIEIHGGKGGRAERLVEVIRGLPEPVRSRLALENDENAYSAAEILAVCRAARVPMVFDAHHHVIHERLDSYEHPSIAEMVAAAATTWPDPAWQLAHISNGRDSIRDRRHSDLITAMPAAYRAIPWIEIEAKSKEIAIRQLQAGLVNR